MGRPLSARKILTDTAKLLVDEMKTATKREKVALSREVREVLADLAALDRGEAVKPPEVPTEPAEPEPDGEVATGDPVDQLRARREKRRADAADSELPAVHEQLGG